MATLKEVAEFANVSIGAAYEVLSGASEVDPTTCMAVMNATAALNYKLKITIRDVADYAGVSPATVSYVINNNPLTKPATRQRVRCAIRSLSYHPNSTARNLKANKTRLIGYAWHMAEDPIRRNPLLDQFLSQLAEYGEMQGYHILTFRQPLGNGMAAYENLVNTNRVDGFILSDVGYYDSRVNRLLEMKMPFVAYGRSNGLLDFPYVDVDGKRGMALAVEHLISKGHQRIALISYLEGLRFGDLRTDGFMDAMQRVGLPMKESWIAHTPNTFDHAALVTLQLLARKPRPTAIVCANDIMAFGAKHAIESLGLEVGTDIALTGYDDTSIAEMIGLTSIRQPLRLIASKVIDLLLADINHHRPSDYQVVLEPSLVIRQSSATARRC